MNPQVMTNQQLVAKIAALYDAGKDYAMYWIELVNRVGEEEAERLVDLA